LTDSVFRQRQDDLLSANLDNLPPIRTRNPNRWRRDSNRDEDNPAFTLLQPDPPHTTPPTDPDIVPTPQPSPPPVDPNAPPPDPPPDPTPDPPPRKGMKEAGQQKRIIIIFGDGSFSPSSPGKLSLVT
jgi:hypothetical protein